MEYYIGIDLGGTNIAAALVDEQGKILGRANLATGAGRPAAEIAADMAHAGRRAAEQAGVPIEQVSAVGMGVPGTANQKEGVLEFANNLGFLHEPIVEMMAGCFPGKKIWFDNDANAAAWGEYLAGGGRGADSMIAVTLGTGVGGGMLAMFMRSIDSKTFQVALTYDLLLIVVLGGIGSIRGSVIATVILYLLPEMLRGLSNYRMLMYAIVLILAMLFNSAPQFVTMRERIMDRFGRKDKKPAKEAA